MSEAPNPIACLHTSQPVPPARKDLIEYLASHPHPQRYEMAKAEKAKVELAKGLAHTPDHKDCPACMATDEILKADPAAMATMTFIEAAAYWRRIRLNDPELKPRTHESVDGSLNALEKFFGHCPMHKISSGMIRQYQDARKKNELLMGSDILHPWKKTPATRQLITTATFSRRCWSSVAAGRISRESIFLSESKDGHQSLPS